MATYTVTLRKDNKDQRKPCPIIITIFDGNRKERYPIGWKVPSINWDEAGRKVHGKHPDKAIINSVISSKESLVKQVIAECQVRNIQIPIGRIFSQTNTGESFNAYLDVRAEQLFKDGKIAIKRKVVDISGEIRLCFGGDWKVRDINTATVQLLKEWFTAKGAILINGKKCRGNKPGTIKKKLAHLSRFYGELIESGSAQAPNPFDGHNLKTVPAKKVKLSEKNIEELELVELKNSNHRLAADMFLFSYYCKGIRFENCATMKKSFIKDGRIYYQINKGNKHLSVKIHSKLQAIIEKYKNTDQVFIFPVFTSDGRDAVLNYFKNPSNEAKEKYKEVINKRNTVLNEWLWKAGLQIGIDNISFHIARHTFAFHLKKVTTNIHIIKESLGHSTAAQTETYLKDLEDDAIDDEVSKLYGL